MHRHHEQNAYSQSSEAPESDFHTKYRISFILSAFRCAFHTYYTVQRLRKSAFFRIIEKDILFYTLTWFNDALFKDEKNHCFVKDRIRIEEKCVFWHSFLLLLFLWTHATSGCMNGSIKCTPLYYICFRKKRQKLFF